MKTVLLSMMLCFSISGLGALSGCDREVAHTEKTTVKSNGTEKHDETTVTQKPDGTIVKEKTSEEKRVNP